MTIESHFNDKKQFFASFFMQLQQLIRELSIAVQLEIDREYFTAKQLFNHLSLAVIQDECKKMKAKHPEILKGMIDIVCSNIITISENKNANNVYTQIPMSLHKSPPTQQTMQSATQMKNKSAENSKNSSKVIKFQPINQFINISPVPVQINNKSLDNTNVPYAQYRRNMSMTAMPKNKQYEPVQLLNKMNKRHSKSINKVQPNQPQKAINSLNFNDKPSSSQKTQIRVNNEQKDYVNNAQIIQIMHKNPYNQENKKFINKKLFIQTQRERQINTNDIKLKMGQQSLTNKYNNKYSYTQDNHTICEALDQRIHQEALQILYKVKSKRSPHRHKQTQYKFNQPTRMKTNISLLNITNDPLPIRRVNRIISPKRTN